MDPQLLRLQKDMPYLFPMMEQTIQNAYQHSQQTAAGMQSSPFFRKRGGFVLHVLVEAMLHRSLEEANFAGITPRVVPNANQSAVHLEIETPNGIIMVAKVTKVGGVPRATKYRQKYIDQAVVAEVYPEYRLFTGECKPLYVITHCPDRATATHADIRIGRLSMDQAFWYCNHPFSLLANSCPVEEITPAENVVEKEEIQKTTRIKLKKA